MDVLVIGDFYCIDRNPQAVRRASEAFTLFEANQRGGE